MSLDQDLPAAQQTPQSFLESVSFSASTEEGAMDADSRPAVGQQPAQEKGTGHSCYCVLIVDDSEIDRLTYQRYVRAFDQAELSFIECESGEEGIQICHQQRPDLVLLDYQLPDLDGLEFLQALQQSALPVPPVIMLTGQGDEKVAVEAMKLGARDYLIKGELTGESLSHAVRRVLSQQALQQLVSRTQQQQQLMGSIAMRISQAQSLSETLQTAVEGMRQLLACDRTVIYRFESDMSGTVVAESVLPGWTACLGLAIEDTCFQKDGTQKYLDGHKTIIPDIYQSNLTPCHITLLERFEVKASLVVPILVQDSETHQSKLWGLLLAHHCRDSRRWGTSELALLDNLSVQLAIAIQQAELIATLKCRAKALSHANRRLATAARQLKNRNRELDEFAYVASHDLRAPLRAINNLAQWLAEDLQGQLSAENQEQLDLIQSRAQRLDQFINGLLEYSRAGRQSLKVEPVGTQSLIEEVIATLAPPPAFKIQRPEKGYTLHTQALLLRQVLANLIGNAIKYHDRADGRVSIGIQEDGDFLSFAITDDGPGIDPAFHQKVFGVFQTLHNRDDVESTGIGLSIVKKVVERQGGEISLRSQLGEGSIFTFTWPKQSP